MNTLYIEKLVFGGQGLGRFNGKVAFVWNALPDEELGFEIIKNKKDYIETVATSIIKSSPHRINPKEPHFLSSGPWEMMDPAYEAEMKKSIALEAYRKNGGLALEEKNLEYYANEASYGYRNKIEFSFTELEHKKISLAFFERGKKYKMPIQSSLLAEDIINKSAAHILKWINEEKIPIRSLKSLIIRSNGQGQSIAALFIKDRIRFNKYPTLSEYFLGFQLYYSTHKSPASVPTELLHHEGLHHLNAELLGTKLKFGLLSFFQINIPVFEQALKDISSFVDPGATLLDYYSGVGAISIPLSHILSKAILVDSNEEAIEYAKENIDKLGLKNIEAFCLPAERALDLISPNDIVVFDPPRAGLHKRIIETLHAKKPKRVIYLSCNIPTQARDIKLLGENYTPRFFKLYNFFPRTPHIESLAVLELKNT
ncbi:MAG: class I SAM-dependent RNA methyltransferase [Candidatus Magasanikbacteria bacterium]|nr:class I SAM-dependent RNA methyltransferase [Candidatus Magasanikbacteria bacterium]